MSQKFSVELKEGQPVVIQFQNPLSVTEFTVISLLGAFILFLAYLKIREINRKN